MASSKRWIGWTIAAGATGLFIFVIFVLPFLAIRSDATRSWILAPGQAGRFLPPGWMLTIRSVERFDPGGVRLSGIRLTDERSGRNVDLAALERLDLDMDPLMFLRRRVVARHLLLDSLAIRLDMEWPRLAKQAGGEARGSGESRERAFQIPWTQIDAVSIRNVEAWRADTLQARASITLDRVEHREGDFSARLGVLAGSIPAESLEVSLVGGTIDASLAGRARIQGSRFLSRGLDSEIDVAIDSLAGGAKYPGAILDWRIVHFAPSEIGSFRRRGVVFDDGDSLSGTIHAEGNPEKVLARLSLSGVVWGAPVDTIRLVAERDGPRVRVEDLELWHRAGRLRANGAATIDSLTVSARLLLSGLDIGDPILGRWIGERPRTRIDGRLEGFADFGRAEPRIEAEGDLEALRIVGRDLGPIWFAGRMDRGRFELDSLRVGVEGDVLAARGSIDPGGSIEGEIRVGRFPLEEWVAPWIHIPLEGEVAGRLRLGGNLRAPNISGNLHSGPFRVLEFYAEQVDVDSVRFEPSPVRMEAMIRCRELDIFKIPADSGSIRLAWDRTMRASIDARLDSLLARAEVEIVPAEPGSLRVDWLSLDPGALAPWQAAIPVRVSWEKGRARIEDLLFESTDGSVQGNLAVGAGGGSLDGSAVLRDIDLDVIRTLAGLPDSSLAGFVDADLRIGGTADDPAVWATVRGRNLMAIRWPLGQCEAAIRMGGDGVVAIDSLRLGRGGGYGAVEADALAAQLPVHLTRFFEGGSDSVAVRLRATPISGSISFDRLSLERIARSALVPTNGGGGILAEPIDPMTARITHTNLGGGNGPASLAEGVSGTLEGQLRIAGTAGAPRLDLEGMLESVKLYQARADSLLFSASYDPQMVVLDSLVWMRDGRASRAVGRFPIALSLVPGETRVLMDEPLRLDAELPEIDLAILGALTHQIQEPSGALTASLRLRGTPRRIWPEGNITIRDGGMRIPQREEKLSRIEGALILDSTGVVIETLTGSFGRDGTFEVAGMFRDLNQFDLQASVRNARLYETGLYSFTADGDFIAYPVVSTLGSFPQVVGTVVVRDGVIVGDLAKAPPPPTGAGRTPSPWRAEIDVRAPGDVRISTAIATVEMGEGDLHVSFIDPMINISGGIEVLGGRYRVFNNIFNITSGTVEFRDTGRGPEPILDINAETRVTDSGAGGEAAQDVTVAIHATGPILELDLEFTSSPERTQDEIIELLSIGRLTDPSTGSLGVADPSRQYIFTELVSQIESQISQLIAPLQNVSLQPGTAPGEAWKLNVRQTVMSQVSVAYSRELEETADEEINLRYNLGGKLYLNAGLERRQNQAGTATDRYSLDLKLRFEYK